jgi:hypothetical protein
MPNTPGREERVLHFDPPYPLFRIAVDEEKGIETVVEEPLGYDELKTKMRVAIPNPWKPDETRFLPGIAYGNGEEFVMEIGQSFGSLGFHESTGWFCRAIIPKDDVMGGLAMQLLERLKFTDRLLKRTGKKKAKKKDG